MKAISIKQPFASLIAQGLKKVEVRSWSTEYRGPLLICAGLRPHEVRPVPVAGLPVGCSLCVVNLVDVTEFKKEQEALAYVNWKPGAFAWHFSGVQPVSQSPVKGQLGLFQIPEHLQHLTALRI